jgi:hypothetical protein
MKKTILVLAILCATAVAAFAVGDKNCNRHQGDIGQGSVLQYQIRTNQ